ncbi:MAG: sialate O-acetylesterase [Planctomycetaceae bacterium]
MKTWVKFLFVVGLFSGSLQARDYKLYYLGGQSNMDGFGYVRELQGPNTAPVSGVMIFHGNQGLDGQPVDGRGVWSELKPGYGTGFKSDGIQNTLSDRFGVELSFARRLRELDPDSNIAIVKYSRGGTSIAADAEAAKIFGCWEPDFHVAGGRHGDINQYDHFLATLRNAFAIRDIDGDGESDTLIPAGIIWMQGESDAGDEDVARRYEANLKRLMDLIRAALRKDDLRVVIGRISDSGKDDYEQASANGRVWEYGEQVRKAQSDFVQRDENAAIVTTTDAYGYSDPWHYDSAGYLDLGARFADAVVQDAEED